MTSFPSEAASSSSPAPVMTTILGPEDAEPTDAGVRSSAQILTRRRSRQQAICTID